MPNKLTMSLLERIVLSVVLVVGLPLVPVDLPVDLLVLVVLVVVPPVVVLVVLLVLVALVALLVLVDLPVVAVLQ